MTPAAAPRDEEVEAAYGKAFGVGPMPIGSKEWFALGYRAANTPRAASEWEGAREACAKACMGIAWKARRAISAGETERLTEVYDRIARTAEECSDVCRALTRPTPAPSAPATENPLTCPKHGQPWGTIYKDGEVEYDCGCKAPAPVPPASNYGCEVRGCGGIAVTTWANGERRCARHATPATDIDRLAKSYGNEIEEREGRGEVAVDGRWVKPTPAKGEEGAGA